MRTKWYFRNDPSPFFGESPAFRPKSIWKTSLGHLNLEGFLSQLEKEFFTLSQKPLRYSNLFKEEWTAVLSLANDRNIVIRKAAKGLCVVIWDHSDYIMEAEKHLSNKTMLPITRTSKISQKRVIESLKT